MAEEKKARPAKHVSAAGRGKYVWVNKPDMKFDEGKGGKFKVDLILEAADAATDKKIIDAAVEAAWAQMTAEIKEKLAGKAAAKIKTLSREYPYVELSDDDGKETGDVQFKFKQNAIIKSAKKGLINVKIPIFDAKGKPISDIVYGGSLLKVSYSMRPYLMESTKKIGVTLDLNAVQVLELVSSSGAADAEGYGFGAEEGYEGEEAPGSEFGAGDPASGEADF